MGTCICICCVYWVVMEQSRRAANVTMAEKQLLVDLVVKHQGLIENKETDKISTSQKNAAWACLAEEFNSASCTKRSSTQLKQVCCCHAYWALKLSSYYVYYYGLLSVTAVFENIKSV